MSKQQMKITKVNSSNFLLIVFFIFLLMGVIFLSVGIFLNSLNSRSKKICTEKTQAVVIKILDKKSTVTTGTKHKRRHTSTTVYCPVFEFTVNGKKYNASPDSYSSPCSYYEGQSYEIFYDPNNPDKIYLPNDSTVQIFTIVFSVIGGAEIAASLIILIVVLKNRKKKNDFIEEQMDKEGIR